MLIWPASIGVLAGCISFLPRFFTPASLNEPAGTSLWFLGIGAFSVLLHRTLLNRREHYFGLADLLLSIHSPEFSTQSLPWVIRGGLSFLFTCVTGFIGGEGVAIEWSYALLKTTGAKSEKWFEDKRRNDAMLSLVGGVSATFGTPFAAVILPLELGMGGRTLSAVVCSLFGYLTFQSLSRFFDLPFMDVHELLDQAKFLHWREWGSVAVVGLISSLASLIVIHFLKFTRAGVNELSFRGAKPYWLKIAVTTLFLAVLALIFQPQGSSNWHLLEQALWDRYSGHELGLIATSVLLGMALILGGFGTAGILWPLFTLGGVTGVLINHLVLSQGVYFSGVAGFIGATVFFGCLLDAPLTAAIIAYEFTQKVEILLPCLIVGLCAQKLRRALKQDSLLEHGLKQGGVELFGGKSKQVLHSIKVTQAMVTDFQTVTEHELLPELEQKILSSPYPFLPVVRPNGEFKDLLSADMIYSNKDKEGPMSASLNRILETQDVLYAYRNDGTDFKIIQDSANLAEVVGLLRTYPCLPVLGSDKTIKGLLFSHDVRLAYEREVARRTFVFLRQGKLSEPV